MCDVVARQLSDYCPNGAIFVHFKVEAQLSSYLSNYQNQHCQHFVKGSPPNLNMAFYQPLLTIVTKEQEKLVK